MAAVAVLVAVLAVATAFSGMASAFALGPGADAGETQVELTLFWGDGCPHCEAERRFLDDLTAEREGLDVVAYEVWHDAANRARFERRAAAAGIEARAVPTTFLGSRVWVGFDDAVAAEIEAAVDKALAGRPTTDAGEGRTTVDVPLVGPVDLGGRSLLWSTVVIGFVDGVNPCSLWVLSILLALVLHSGSRRRVLAVGAAFLAVTSLMYGLYIAGVWGLLSVVGYLPWVQAAVAVVVGTLGVLQLRTVVVGDRGPTVGIPASAKPDLYARMRRLGDPQRSLPVVLATTAALAVGVSVLETPCTLGLPILWTDLLATAGVGAAGSALLFSVYLAVFLVDELVLFALVVLTMRAVRLQEHHGRELRLVSGVVMVTLAVVLVTVPEAMERVTGALAVFGLAAAVAAVLIVIDRHTHGTDRHPRPAAH